MTALQAHARISAFLASGHAGSVTLHVAAPGQPGHRGVICTVEIHERLAISKGESAEALLDTVATPGA
jgi:hypothetical protein